MKKLIVGSFFLLATSFSPQIFADGHKIYGPYPITLQGYSGDKTN